MVCLALLLETFDKMCIAIICLPGCDVINFEINFEMLACCTKYFFFGKLDQKVVSDNITFWETVAPLSSEKAFHKKSIILNNSNKTICNNEERGEIFNKHFSKLR